MTGAVSSEWLTALTAILLKNHTLIPWMGKWITFLAARGPIR